MKSTHNALNGENCPYAHSTVWTNGKPYTNDQIASSLIMRGQFLLKVNINDGHQNAYGLEAFVASATSIPDNDAAWILTLDGMLTLAVTDGSTTSVNVVCYYNTENGRGFCLLPHRARAMVWAHNSN